MTRPLRPQDRTPAARHGLAGLGAAIVVLAACAPTGVAAGETPRTSPLDPRGQIHIPIGIANTVDTLKTFVEAEGYFSPGFATYGIYFWVYDPETKTVIAPTMDPLWCGLLTAPRHRPAEKKSRVPFFSFFHATRRSRGKVLSRKYKSGNAPPRMIIRSGTIRQLPSVCTRGIS